MAQVDFSDAIINSFPSAYSRTSWDFDGLGLGAANFRNSSQQTISTNMTISTYSESIHNKAFRYVGSFTGSGTEFWIWCDANYPLWHVTNISFSSGDTFDFIVDTIVEVV